MTNPFDNNEKFKSLSEDAKQIVMTKYNALSDEAKSLVMKKLGPQPGQPQIPIPDDVKNEPGLQDVSLTPLPKKTMDRSAIDVAEGLTPIVGPQLAKYAGAAFEMIPSVVDAAVTVGGTASLAKAGIKAAPAIAEGAMPYLKAFVPGAKQAVGKAIGELEAKAGVEQVIPTVSNMAKRLNLPARERGFADIVNSVKKTMAEGKPIPEQDLVDFKDLVKQQYGADKIPKGTRYDALTAITNKKAEQILNQLIPGRSKLSKDYATMSKIHSGIKKLAIYGGATGGIGLAGAILRKIVKG